MLPSDEQERAAILNTVLDFNRQNEIEAAFANSVHKNADMLNENWQLPLQTLFAY